MKNPVVITSLEEDFKKIGLIKATPSPMQESADEPDESLVEYKAQTAAEIRKRGGKRRGPIGSGRSAKVMNVSSVGDRRERAKKAKGKKTQIARTRAKWERSPKGRKSMRARKEGVESEALKAFANAAIIADKLAGIFTEWVKADIYESEDERMFAAVAGELGEIAESFADIATAMSEGKLEESSDEDIAAAFAEGLETVLDAVDLYEANADDEDDEDGEDEDESGND